ncbi:MAG: chromate resistance protein [Armatimonadota bacterium]|nr:chromate resistance protein [Armatimonadota bacterium]
MSGVKWVTRKNANVDRVACPWLIKRFIDAHPAFLFVPAEDVLSVAGREGAIPFDVQGAELGHVDGRCSFESILVKYNLTDPALRLLGRIVHGADIPAELTIEPEAAGLRAAAYGFAMLHGEDDHEKLRVEAPMYDALYAWCQHRVSQGG